MSKQVLNAEKNQDKIFLGGDRILINSFHYRTIFSGIAAGLLLCASLFSPPFHLHAADEYPSIKGVPVNARLPYFIGLGGKLISNNGTFVVNQSNPATFINFSQPIFYTQFLGLEIDQNFFGFVSSPIELVKENYYPFKSRSLINGPLAFYIVGGGYYFSFSNGTFYNLDGNDDRFEAFSGESVALNFGVASSIDLDEGLKLDWGFLYELSYVYGSVLGYFRWNDFTADISTLPFNGYNISSWQSNIFNRFAIGFNFSIIEAIHFSLVLRDIFSTSIEFYHEQWVDFFSGSKNNDYFLDTQIDIGFSLDFRHFPRHILELPEIISLLTFSLEYHNLQDFSQGIANNFHTALEAQFNKSVSLSIAFGDSRISGGATFIFIPFSLQMAVALPQLQVTPTGDRGFIYSLALVMGNELIGNQ